MNKKIAVICAILDDPSSVQGEFNEIVSSYKDIVKFRSGFPMHEEQIAIITLVVTGELDMINALTGKLGTLSNVWVSTSFSKKEL